MPRTRPFVTSPEAYDQRIRKPDVKYVVFDLTGDDTPAPVPLVRSPARPLLSLLNHGTGRAHADPSPKVPTRTSRAPTDDRRCQIGRKVVARQGRHSG
jgi:hypothetical protein